MKDAYLKRGPARQVNDPALDKRPPVVNSYRDVTAIVFVHHSNGTAERERFVCGCHRIHIVDLTIRCLRTMVIGTVPACNP